MNGLQLIVQRLLIISACCTALAGCSPQPAVSDPGAAKKLLNDTLEAWKSGKQPDDLKLQSPPIFVGEPRWSKGAKLKEFSIAGDGEYFQSSVKLQVRMKIDKDSKPREVFYWVSTNPANSVTLAE